MSVQQCAWCGAEIESDRPPKSCRGEVFCSVAHRQASARAVKALLDADAPSPWTSHGKGKVGRYDEHVSGWTVRHCGHPTANWPWFAVSPDGKPVCAGHGQGWRKLSEARADIEGVIAGKLKISYQYASRSGGERFGRVVPRCYACDQPATGRAIPGGHPDTPDEPACDRHRWHELGVNPFARMSAEQMEEWRQHEARWQKREARRRAREDAAFATIEKMEAGHG